MAAQHYMQRAEFHGANLLKSKRMLQIAGTDKLIGCITIDAANLHK